MATLQEVMDNPALVDSLDAEQHAALMREIAGESPEAAPATEPKADEAAATDAASEATETSAAEPKVEKQEAVAEEPKPTAILAPDGKSTIPYSVLQGERQARQAAEQATNRMGEQLAEMQERLKTLEAGDTPKAAKEADDLRAEIAALADEAPALAPLHTKLVDRIEATEKKQAERDAADEEAREQARQRVIAEVNTNIDNNVALRTWKAERQDLFEEATAFDEVLAQQPQWQGKPMAERFAHVVNLMVANHEGEAILPAGATPKADPAPEPKKPDAAAIVKAAEAKLAKATPTVTTLSDLPAGAAPEQSEKEQLENMSITQVAARFEKMSPDQQQAYLRSVET